MEQAFPLLATALVLFAFLTFIKTLAWILRVTITLALLGGLGWAVLHWKENPKHSPTPHRPVKTIPSKGVGK
jgi:hypothetical protein